MDAEGMGDEWLFDGATIRMMQGITYGITPGQDIRGPLLMEDDLEP